jgi:hypothetical protein
MASRLFTCELCGSLVSTRFPVHNCTPLTTYTVWFRYAGSAHKEFFQKRYAKDEMEKYLADRGYEDILVWEGNWFGLAPDNIPEPDYTYGIQKRDEK